LMWKISDLCDCKEVCAHTHEEPIRKLLPGDY
jgi:hypothetical protein